MPLPDLLVSVDHPFPGLRPFESGESLLFFGRDEHTQELLRRLGDGRFLAVVGTSGSGKSSLVRAGLLPALYRGYLVGSTTHWRIAVMRPGSAPIENLCAALADRDALGPGDAARRLELLHSSSLGLVDVVRGANLEPGESLLIVADQFEELFRYQRQTAAGNDAADAASAAALFVSLLLQATERFDCPVYVVLTMRSDFLGDCSQFAGLPEALSRSQYLIPRLTREQRQQAIERPLQLAGIGITRPLVQRLLNDSSDEAALLGAGAIARGGMPDPLPVLQHALMRICENWKQAGDRGDLDLQRYAAVGGIQDALNQHADSIYDKLGASGQAWAAKIFRCLTATEAGRPVRRPTRLDRLYEIAGAATDADRAETDAVLRSFLDRENSLLVSSSLEGLKPEAVIDIPHESLIWKWQRLRDWVRKEAVSAEWYLDLVKDADSFRKGETGLWRDPNLGRALEIQRTEGWNQSWAAQVHPSADTSYADALGFLGQSRKAQSKERWIRRIGVAVVVIALVASFFYRRRGREAEENNRILLGQVGELKNQSENAQRKADRYASDLAQKTASLAGVLSPKERSVLEKQVKELKDKVDQSQKTAEQLKVQQDEAAKVAASGGDLKDVVKTLQTRVEQSDARIKTLDKDLGDERTRNSTLQDSLDKLKQQLAEANKERDALKKAAVPAPVKEPLATGKSESLPPPATVVAAPVKEPGAANEALKPGTVHRNPLDGLDYVWIPKGSFTMGCSPGVTECVAGYDPPPHAEQIAEGFWLGRTEVTQAAWKKVKGGHPSHFKGAQLPVENVDWTEAASYCKAIGGRLPSEKEWEYAVRARTTGPRYGQPNDVAWHIGNSKGTTHPVGLKQANGFGLYDMLGNVWEWTSDDYDAGHKVVRGGSWDSDTAIVRAAFRNGFGPSDRDEGVGFRCVGEFR